MHVPDAACTVVGLAKPAIHASHPFFSPSRPAHLAGCLMGDQSRLRQDGGSPSKSAFKGTPESVVKLTASGGGGRLLAADEH